MPNRRKSLLTALIAALDDERRDARFAAARLLFRLAADHNTPCIDLLAEAAALHLRDEADEISLLSLEALGRVRAPWTTLRLIKVFGKHDNIVRPDQAHVLSQGVPHAHIQSMSRSRHFPMLDEPDAFRQTLVSFLVNGHLDGTLS